MTSAMLLETGDTQGRLCRNLQDPPLGRRAWNRLLQRSEFRSIFLTYPWIATWVECHQDDGEPWVVAVLRQDSLIGIAPLALRRVHGQRVLEFIGMGASDYCDILAAEEDKEAVVAAVMDTLLRRRDRWDRLELRYLPEHSSTARALQRYTLPSPWELHVETEFVCPALSIEKSPPFAQACTRKKSLVRHTRYFERLAPLRFRHLLDPDEIADRLPEFYEQHRDRRFMAGDRSVFDDTRHRRFTERVVERLLETGWLRFSILEWGDEVLAFHLGFCYDGVFTWYKPTFNVDYARYSPGEVLLKKLLENALEEGVREFDFTVGDESFKERFANVKRHNLKITVQRRRPVGWLQGLAARARLRLKERAPQWHARLRRWAARCGLVPPEPCPVTLPPAGAFTPPRTGFLRRSLLRLQPVPAVPSEFRAVWGRYSQIKTLARREGWKSDVLMHALARLRRGERPVVLLWHERPVAVVWLARDAREVLGRAGFAIEIEDDAVLLTESALAADVRMSPRRETVVPTLVTFLAAEGFGPLYLIEAAEHSSLPRLCGAALDVVALRTDIGLGFRQLVHFRVPGPPTRTTGDR